MDAIEFLQSYNIPYDMLFLNNHFHLSMAEKNQWFMSGSLISKRYTCDRLKKNLGCAGHVMYAKMPTEVIMANLCSGLRSLLQLPKAADVVFR